jgi:hypothetical protein
LAAGIVYVRAVEGLTYVFTNFTAECSVEYKKKGELLFFEKQ